MLKVGEESNVRGSMLTKEKKGVGFKVGEGNRVWFWVNDWVGVGTVFVVS